MTKEGRPVSALAIPFKSSGQTSIFTGLSIQQQWADQYLYWPFQSTAMGNTIWCAGRDLLV